MVGLATVLIAHDAEVSKPADMTREVLALNILARVLFRQKH